MNKITIKEEIEKVELRELKPGQIFEYSTNYYMKMEPLENGYVKDVGNCIWCCELGTGRMCIIISETKVKPIYGTVEILV